MKRNCLKKNSRATASVIGMVTALILLSGTVWAEKNDTKIEVKTDGSSAVQQTPADQRAPGYLDPIREMIKVQREMDQFFGQPFASFNIMPGLPTAWDDEFVRPDMDLTEQADAYHVQMDLPGMDKSGIAVEVKDNILTVTAESKKETTQKEGDKLLMQERSSGFMSRAVMLAKPVDAKKVTAEYQNGVLNITLPKVQADQAPQEITVK
ncbi:MAG: Hsp20/alpha crystallin family protein [Kiritimatiellaeota bacterium]|nr:Hsp20/alpha crystallin family protein [Kiritimatiellota bacterium]